jgi:hypothetical protein
MMKLGRLPLFSMRTSEELREEGRGLNLEWLIGNQPLKPEPRLGMKDEPHPSEERRDRDQ